MKRTRLILLALVLILASVPLLGCGLCRTMADSAQKLFGTKGETTSTTDASGTVVETQLPPPPPPDTAQDHAPLEILTQQRGNHTRTVILDAIRSYRGMGDERGSLFVVLWLGKKGNWAMMQGRTESGGTPIEALVHWNAAQGNWVVAGFSNAGWKQVTPAGYPMAPVEIFSGTRSWPKERASNGGTSGFQNLTNRKGNSTRTAILDAARSSMGWEINGRKIIFTVKWMAAQDGWAYFVGEEYNVKLPFDMLLRKSGGDWTVVDTQGEGDFPRTIRQKNPDLPQAIFDGY